MLLAFAAMDKWRTTATGRVSLAGPPFVVVRRECETAAASSEAQRNAFVGCLFSYKITREVRVLRTIAAVAAVASSLGLGVSTRPQQSAAASAVQKETAETCRISGTVLKFAEGTPLKGATVWLENDEDHEHMIATKTTADGRFELRNVPSGRYKLKVSRNGYVEMEYGQKKPSDPGAAFSLSPGQTKKDLVFKLIPAAVIAGRVFDEDGEPVPGAEVRALREIYHEGRLTLTTQGFAQTDDLGQFRLFGLAPGRYYVSAMERQWGKVNGDREFSANSEQGVEHGYTKTYYPGTPDVAKASAIGVKEGDEIPGTDIPLKQVAVYRIRGRVLNQITHKGGNDANLVLLSRGKKLEWNLGGQSEVKKSDGSFEFSNVAPGSYLLVAYWGDDEGKEFSAQEKVDVGERDVEGVTLSIGAGATIPGRIRWEGKPSLDREELIVYLQPTEVAFQWGGSARVEASQQFTLRNVNEGDYRVAMIGASKDCYVKDIVYGGTHAPDDTISVSKGGGAPLEVTISSRGARIQGAVTDKDGLPAAGVWVVAVPDQARRLNFLLFKSQTTDQYGRFDLHGLTPGNYKLFSWESAENHEWEGQEFLKPYEEKGEAIEVHEEESKTLNLKVIERKSERTQ